MKVIMVYSYTDRSESVCGEGDARLDINNTVVDIARKCPTLGEIKKIEESLCSYPDRCDVRVINVIKLAKDE